MLKRLVTANSISEGSVTDRARGVASRHSLSPERRLSASLSHGNVGPWIQIPRPHLEPCCSPSGFWLRSPFGGVIDESSGRGSAGVAEGSDGVSDRHGLTGQPKIRAVGVAAEGQVTGNGGYTKIHSQFCAPPPRDPGRALFLSAVILENGRHG